MPPQGRIPALDIARTAALAGMIVFHTAFDLQLFGHLPPGTVSSGLWPYFSRLVAGSFLFLAGVSLWLAHGHAVRWPAFWRRFAILAAAAALVTVGTYFGIGDAYVRFGILHSIAVCSLLGLATLRLPAAVTLALAAAILMTPQYLRHEMFNAPWLYWVGLATQAPYTVDYEPVFPWLAPLLAGVATARLAGRAALWSRLRTPAPDRRLRVLSWPGRHSLAIYLIHQPVIFGAIYLGTLAMR